MFFALLVVVLIFLALGRFYPGSGAEQVDWKPTRSPELEAELELEDVEQMLEAQNERRRRSGRPELTEEDMEARVREDEQWRAEQLDRSAPARPALRLGPRPDRGLRLSRAAPGVSADGGGPFGAGDDPFARCPRRDAGRRDRGGGGRPRPAWHDLAPAAGRQRRGLADGHRAGVARRGGRAARAPAALPPGEARGLGRARTGLRGGGQRGPRAAGRRARRSCARWGRPSGCPSRWSTTTRPTSAPGAGRCCGPSPRCWRSRAIRR